jgi:hypothetical protein
VLPTECVVLISTSCLNISFARASCDAFWATSATGSSIASATSSMRGLI